MQDSKTAALWLRSCEDDQMSPWRCPLAQLMIRFRLLVSAPAETGRIQTMTNASNNDLDPTQCIVLEHAAVCAGFVKEIEAASKKHIIALWLPTNITKNWLRLFGPSLIRLNLAYSAVHFVYPAQCMKLYLKSMGSFTLQPSSRQQTGGVVMSQNSYLLMSIWRELKGPKSWFVNFHFRGNPQITIC